MSNGDSDLKQEDIELVWELSIEPSYISEIARKLQEYSDRWADVSENTAVRRVAKIVEGLSNRDKFDVETEGADVAGQSKGSPKRSFGPGGYIEETEWRDYKLIHNVGTPLDEAREDIKKFIDTDVTYDDKVSIIRTLSGRGNTASQDAEKIMQDVMERQFREYENTNTPDYNDPGVDFYVEDEDRRNWGLSIEISVRWVNPIDSPYLDSKKEKAFNMDSDLLIMAPKFTRSLLVEYENSDSPNWHSDPLSENIHLHRVPPKGVASYRPFATSPSDIEPGESSSEGNPVVIPDSERTREALSEGGHVGDNYPIVDSSFEEFRESMDVVLRDFRVVTESNYRNQIRESLEPLLWEFMRPYRIEQFLMNTFWKMDLPQEGTTDAGSFGISTLTDVTRGTIGTWMGQTKWDIATRTLSSELGEETMEIWARMYEGIEPFLDEFSGYRIQAEWNRHPLWSLDEWREWYESSTEEERKETMSSQDSFRDNIGYTMMFGPETGILPSYSFILSTISGRNNGIIGGVLDDVESQEDVTIPRSKNGGIDIREPDEAPRVPYDAYPSRGTLSYMINRDETTIVEVEEDGE